MNWILSNLSEIGLAIMIMDRIATATPPTLVIAGIPIGKYDDQVVGVFKSIFKLFINRNGKKG